MAETKRTTKTTTKKTTTSRPASVWGLNKISFWCIGAMAILYLIASVLSLCGVNSKLIPLLQGLATAVAICIVAYLAWRYVAHKPTVWKVLFFVLLLVVLLGIVLPLVI